MIVLYSDKTNEVVLYDVIHSEIYSDGEPSECDIRLIKFLVNLKIFTYLGKF